MRHPTDGELRLLVDDNQDGDAEARRHAAGCARCAARFDGLRAASDVARAQFASLGEPATDAGEALHRFRVYQQRVERTEGMSDFGKRRWSPVWAGGVVAVALLLAVFAAPVRTAALSLFDVFRVERFAAIAIDPSQPPFSVDTEGMAKGMMAERRAAAEKVNGAGTHDGERPDPNIFGTYNGPTEPEAPKQVASLEAAAAVVGYEPAEAGDAVGGRELNRIFTSEGATASYTFDTQKIEAVLKRKGLDGLVRVPEQIDGQTFTLRGSNGVWVQYGDEERSVVFAQGPSPELEIPEGVNMDYLRQDFLSIPGLPQDLVAQVQAIEDWERTLIVPLPPGGASREVRIDGAEGLLISDRTGDMHVVLWQRDGKLYALGGKLAEGDALEAARGVRYP